MTVELVLLTPVVMTFALFAVGLGRYELAREDVIGAARAAAEAAAVAGTSAQAQLAANAAADPGLQSLGNTCKSVDLETDTDNFVPGGSVRVTVTCHVSFSDLLIPGLPGSAVVTAVQTAPIDPFRSVQ